MVDNYFFPFIRVKYMDSSWFKIKELADSVFMIQEPLRRLAPDYLTNSLNLFVVHDQKEALIIDCGTGVYSISDLVFRTLGKRTIVTPFITHAHWDHVGSLHEFESVLIHKEEMVKLQSDENLDIIREDVKERNDSIINDMANPFIRKKFEGEPIHVKDGEWIKVGKIEMQIIYLPGHTKGSIGIWHPDEKFLFVGDSLQTGYVYADENPSVFVKTLEKLRDIIGTYYLPSHEEILLQTKDIEDLIEMFSKIEKNELKLILFKNRYLDNVLYKGERFSIILPSKNKLN